MKNLLITTLVVLGCGIGTAQAQCPPTNSSPAFTAGGSVFGRIASQWNAYFASKVDATNGVLCNPTIIGGTQPGAFTVSPGLTNLQGTRNTVGNAIASGAQLSGQLWPVTKSASYSVNTDFGGISDSGALLIAGAGSVTFSAPNPNATTKGVSYQFASDGTHGFTLTTISGTALIYGCPGFGSGVTSAVVAVGNSISVTDNGTTYQCRTVGQTADASQIPYPPGTVKSSLDALNTTVNFLDYGSASGLTTTGSITGSTSALTLASAIDFGSAIPCINGGGANCGIVVAGAGPNVTVATPTGFNVGALCSTLNITGDTTSGSKLVKNVSNVAGISSADNITGNGIPASTTVASIAYNPNTIRLSANATATATGVALGVVDPCTGSYQYRIASADGAGGISAAAAVQTIQSVSGITLTAGGSSYATPPTVAITGGGCTVAPTATASVSGGKVTGLTLTGPGTGCVSIPAIGFSGGGGSGAAATASIGGPLNLNTWNNVCLTWSRPGGTVPTGYPIWRSLDGGSTWHFWQISNVEGSGACALASAPGPDLDLGQRPQARPWWVPDSPTGSVQNDWLRTTISAGAGTTALTLQNQASNTVAGAVVYHDDTPGWLAWFTFLNATGAEGLIPAQTVAGSPAVVRVAAQGLVNTSGVSITAQRGATIKPFGTFPFQSVITFFGPNAGATVYPLTTTFAEGMGCVPISGLTPGQYLLLTEGGPGGPSQSVNYSLMSPIASLTCENQYARLTDPTPITYNQSTVVAISGTVGSGNSISVTANAVTTLSGFSSPTTVTYNEVGGDTTPTLVATHLAAAINATSVLTNVGIGAYASGPSVILFNGSGSAVNWTATSSGTTIALTGPAGAIVAGTVTPGDTVTMTASGDVSCAPTYTVVGGDDASLVARNLAIQIFSSCAASGVNASSTINMIKISAPSTAAITWTPSTTGGHTTLTSAFGTGAVAHTMAPITNVGLRSVSIDGSDALSALGLSIIGLSTFDTALSTFDDISISNIAPGAGFYGQFDYGSRFSRMQMTNASGGVPNVNSYSDWWLIGCTKSQIDAIQSVNANSFGSQFDGCSGVQVHQFSQRGAAAGRGFKLAAVAGSSFDGIESSQNVFDGIAITSGTSKNLLSNITTLYNGFGLNYSGIAFFDAFDQFNTWTNVRSTGQQYDISNGTSDLNNLWTNILPGTNNLGGAGTYPDILNPGQHLFLNLPNCAVATLNQGSGAQCTSYTGLSGLNAGQLITNGGFVGGGPVQLNGVPTSCSGLVTGRVWNNSGVLSLCP